VKRLNKEKLSEFKHLSLQLCRFLNEWDPLGIMDTPSGDTVNDEYECQAASLLSLLNRKAGKAEIISHLTRELTGHFGVNPALHNPDELVEKMMTWYDKEITDFRKCASKRQNRQPAADS
jgi:hypothetical protein